MTRTIENVFELAAGNNLIVIEKVFENGRLAAIQALLCDANGERGGYDDPPPIPVWSAEESQ